MTDDKIALREMFGFAAQRLMELDCRTPDPATPARLLLPGFPRAPQDRRNLADWTSRLSNAEMGECVTKPT
jgi:hypothetical protein